MARPPVRRVLVAAGRGPGDNGPVRVRAISRRNLIEWLADEISRRCGPDRLRVAVDGAPAAAPDDLADALVDPLRLRGHAAVRVRAADYLRPASLRFERGRSDPDSLYDDFLDTAALNREALAPLAAGEPVRTRHWDAAADRAARDAAVPVPAGGVLLLSGGLLLGQGLAVDMAVHLSMSGAALARRTPAELAWTLPAYARYADEVDPAGFADVVVLVDHPDRPALVEAG